MLILDYHASKPTTMVHNHFNQSQFTLHMNIYHLLGVLKRMFEHLLCGLSSILILMNQYTWNITSCGVQILQTILMYNDSLRSKFGRYGNQAGHVGISGWSRGVRGPLGIAGF